MTGTLADPLAARDHARSMAGTVVEAMPMLPPVADDLPADVAAADLLWEETIAAGGYATRRLPRGARLRLIDLAGDACASLLIFNAEMPTERLNVADTVKVQWNAYLGAGRLLLSDMGKVMMSIIGGRRVRRITTSSAAPPMRRRTRRANMGTADNWGPSSRTPATASCSGCAKHRPGAKVTSTPASTGSRA